MSENSFEGIYPAITTPINDDNSINYPALENHLDYLEQNGVHGVVPAGCTGHAAALGDHGEGLYEEHTEFISKTAEYTDLPLLAGTGMNTPKQAIELATKVEENADIDAHMMIAGYVNCPPQDQLVDHYKKVASEVEEPIVAYTVPGRTGTDIGVDGAVELAETEGIVGLKEASEDTSQVYEILRELERTGNEDFDILSGVDSLNHFFYDAGGTGAISVSANLAPEESVEVWEAGYLEDDRQESYERNRELQDLHSAMFQEGEKNPIGVQYGMNLMGFDYGTPRPPLDREPRQDQQYNNRKEIEQALDDLDLPE